MDGTDPAATFRGRARILFGLLIGVVVVSAVIVLASDPDIPATGWLIPLASVALAVIVLAVVFVGLGTSSAWAIPAAIWVSVVIVVAGVIRSLIKLVDGQVDIPLEAIAGAIVLAARPSGHGLDTLAPDDRRTAVLLIGGYVVASVIPYLPVTLMV